MFLGGITDFLFPDLISNVIDAMQARDQDDVIYRLKMWLVIIFIGAVSTGLNSILFGLTSERVGRSLRNKLFNSLILKDTSFYDESRVGDLRKFSLVNQFCSFTAVYRYSSCSRWFINIFINDGQVSLHLHRNGRHNVHLQLETDNLRIASHLTKLVL